MAGACFNCLLALLDISVPGGIHLFASDCGGHGEAYVVPSPGGSKNPSSSSSVMCFLAPSWEMDACTYAIPDDRCPKTEGLHGDLHRHIIPTLQVVLVELC